MEENIQCNWTHYFELSRNWNGIDHQTRNELNKNDFVPFFLKQLCPLAHITLMWKKKVRPQWPSRHDEHALAWMASQVINLTQNFADYVNQVWTTAVCPDINVASKEIGGEMMDDKEIISQDCTHRHWMALNFICTVWPIIWRRRARNIDYNKYYELNNHSIEENAVDTRQLDITAPCRPAIWLVHLFYYLPDSKSLLFLSPGTAKKLKGWTKFSYILSPSDPATGS